MLATGQWEPQQKGGYEAMDDPEDGRSGAGYDKHDMNETAKAYFRMHEQELGKRPCVKARVEQRLAESLRRSRRSVQVQMQRISAVLEDLNHPHIRGYKPSHNSPGVAQRIRRAIFDNGLLSEDAYQATADPQELDRRVETLLRKPIVGIPLGEVHPEKQQVTRTVTKRLPVIVAKVIQIAEGTCELCGKRPFKDKSGRPYLEVHHVQPLGEGGADTVDNAVALCPDCHARSHHAENTDAVAEEIREAKRIRRPVRKDRAF